MDKVWGVYAFLSLLAAFEAIALVLYTYENARHFRSRLREPRPHGFTPRVELFVPCKGLDPGFESMVRTVLHQDYPHYGVTFVVESQDDPAYQALQSLLNCNPAVRTRLIVAGLAMDCGQKVHNLRTATAQPRTGCRSPCLRRQRHTTSSRMAAQAHRPASKSKGWSRDRLPLALSSGQELVRLGVLRHERPSHLCLWQPSLEPHLGGLLGHYANGLRCGRHP